MERHKVRRRGGRFGTLVVLVAAAIGLVGLVGPATGAAATMTIPAGSTATLSGASFLTPRATA
jgi:hypothetical protein